MGLCTSTGCHGTGGLKRGNWKPWPLRMNESLRPMGLFPHNCIWAPAQTVSVSLLCIEKKKRTKTAQTRMPLASAWARMLCFEKDSLALNLRQGTVPFQLLDNTWSLVNVGRGEAQWTVSMKIHFTVGHVILAPATSLYKSTTVSDPPKSLFDSVSASCVSYICDCRYALHSQHELPPKCYCRR